ncbi:MAG: BMC domain-containing protein [Chloroflexi bacterium]|nr:BMC domain-containing protein [Chloroflexota bacterium]MCC6891770.1 BMC domain-containing protein [Anaerolineae bacterium]
MAQKEITPAQPLVIEPALALLEISSIAIGILTVDAMVKRTALEVVHAGTVHPGHFLILVGGPVAEVEEAITVAKEMAADTLTESLFLANVHPDVVSAIGSNRKKPVGDALGIIETYHVPAAIQAADAGIKGAEVRLLEVRLAEGLHGKGLVFFNGDVSDVEASVEMATGVLKTDQIVRKIVIPQLHAEVMDILIGSTRFGVQIGWAVGNTDDD